MASKVAQKRLQKEYLAMQKAPPPFIWAVPEEKNILDWHFIIRGPPDTPYAGGEYHGLIWFPSDYPFKPPDVKMFTPTGRFECGAKICMSMTSYHPSTWNAAWSVATILTGLLSFMLSDEITAGAVKTTDAQKREFAAKSHAFNLNSKKFREIFPKYATPGMTDLPDMGQQPSSSNAEVKGGASTALDTPISSGLSTPASTNPNTRTQSPAIIPPNPLTPPTLVDVQNGPQLAVQQRQPPNARWIPSWRWLVAIVVLAVLGRISRAHE
jgi:ubiquitin-conjugating enzyme E2 J2